MQTEWKSKILTPADGPVFTRDEYNFLIEAEFLTRLGEGEALIGFVKRVDDLATELQEAIEGELDETDTEIAKVIKDKLFAHLLSGKWIFIE